MTAMGVQGFVLHGNTAARGGARIEVSQLVHVNFDREAAFVLNLSEGGMAIQAMAVLEPGHSLDFSFPLPETSTAIHGQARIIWSDRSGRAGLLFTDMPALDRLQLRNWVFTQQHGDPQQASLERKPS